MLIDLNAHLSTKDAALIAESRNLLKAALALVEIQHQALAQIATTPIGLCDSGYDKMQRIASDALALGNADS